MKSRPTRSGTAELTSPRMVVRGRRRRWTPARPCWRIRRATRLRPTRIPEPQAQLGVHARRAVRAPALGVDPRDDRAEDFVAESPLALRTSAPGIEASVGDAKHAAGGAHRGLLALDEPEHRYRLRLPLSWAKKAAAGSTRQRNVALHRSGRGLIAEGLAGATVQSPRDLVELGLAVA